MEKIKKIKLGIGFLVFLLLITSVFASPPPIPDKFTGEVKVGDNDAPIDTEIKVYVNDELDGVISTTIIGEYSLYVKKGNSGDEITFKILDQLAGTSEREGGQIKSLNLSVDEVEEDDPVDPEPISNENPDDDDESDSSNSREIVKYISSPVSENVDANLDDKTQVFITNADENLKQESITEKTIRSISKGVLSSFGVIILGLMLIVLFLLVKLFLKRK